MSAYKINLDIFSGPLDLLLYLVRKEEVDIYDIPISRITEEYIRHIEMIKMLNIELAGEFLVMAAALMAATIVLSAAAAIHWKVGSQTLCNQHGTFLLAHTAAQVLSRCLRS